MTEEQTLAVYRELGGTPNPLYIQLLKELDTFKIYGKTEEWPFFNTPERIINFNRSWRLNQNPLSRRNHLVIGIRPGGHLEWLRTDRVESQSYVEAKELGILADQSPHLGSRLHTIATGEAIKIGFLKGLITEPTTYEIALETVTDQYFDMLVNYSEHLTLAACLEADGIRSGTYSPTPVPKSIFTGVLYQAPNLLERIPLDTIDQHYETIARLTSSAIEGSTDTKNKKRLSKWLTTVAQQVIKVRRHRHNKGRELAK